MVPENPPYVHHDCFLQVSMGFSLKESVHVNGNRKIHKFVGKGSTEELA